MGGGKPAARQGDMQLQRDGYCAGFSRGADRCANRCGLLGVSHKKDSPNYGSPVNPLLGAKVLPVETDLALPGPLPFILFRAYSSYRTLRPRQWACLVPAGKRPSISAYRYAMKA